MRQLYNGILKVPKQLLSQQAQNNQAEETESNVPKQIKIARLYSLLYLIKSLVTAFIIVLLPNSIYEFKIWLLLVFRTVCIVNIIYNRSFESRKDHVVEILNESIFITLIVISNYFRSESDWNKIVEGLYIGIVLTHLLVLFTISGICGFVTIIAAAKSCKTRTLNRSKNKIQDWAAAQNNDQNPLGDANRQACILDLKNDFEEIKSSDQMQRTFCASTGFAPTHHPRHF